MSGLPLVWGPDLRDLLPGIVVEELGVCHGPVQDWGGRGAGPRNTVRLQCGNPYCNIVLEVRFNNMVP